MHSDSKIFVAGAAGMAGSAIVRRLRADGFHQILGPRRTELDLLDQAATSSWFDRERPEVVVVAAGRVGGIQSNNTYPVEFLRDNLAIAQHAIEGAFRVGAARLIFLGSSCIYPRLAPQPIREDSLLTGPLEPTNEAYAIAKIAGLKLCEYYRRQHGVLFHSLMPTNLFGPGDNYHPKNSHVLPALIRRFHEAKETGAPEMVIWGTGTPLREFMHADDLADAVVFLLRHPEPPDLVNVGTGAELSIRALAETVGRIVGYTGALRFDTSKPDGTPRKLLDVSRLTALGWRASIPFEEGVRRTYLTFLDELKGGTLREV